ncbi:head GIN domain-containing protein [Abyssalbus ytuae]|uniref:DUF2807 domain-containing protein n=1 Tax=Abyssalbus ytuae TaxID=2926907 RepID=A0A9E6ZNU8_9FLAO|nr:head GIN domain-containing protein [Abyssalbus ytuae]UOB19322.1 DUF2807 domain-containing protein [Abyssalbus ytuae]
MKRIIFFLFFIVSGFSFSQDNIVIETGDFTEIKAFDGLTVNLIRSFENKVVVYGDDKDKVAVVNNDGRLKVRMTIGKIYGGKKTYVDVYHSKELDLIDANEGAFISSTYKFIQTYMSLKVQEGGEIHVEVETDKLDIRAVTAGKIEIKGKAVNQDVQITTGGKYEAEGLLTEQAKVVITTGGYAYINTTEYVEAKVKMGGTIKIYGNTRVIEKTVFIGGNIVEM